MVFIVLSKDFLPKIFHQEGHWQQGLQLTAARIALPTAGPLQEPIQPRIIEHLLRAENCIHIISCNAPISPAHCVILNVSSHMRK